MKYLFLLLAFYSAYSFSNPLDQSCPRGYFNDYDTVVGEGGQPPPACSSPSRVCGSEQVEGGGTRYYIAPVADCGQSEDSTDEGAACSPTGGAYFEACGETKECETSGGSTFSLTVDKSCDDFCKVKSSLTNEISYSR